MAQGVGHIAAQGVEVFHGVRGQVQVNVPYVALSMFESTAQSNVYYRVAFDRGAGDD